MEPAQIVGLICIIVGALFVLSLCVMIPVWYKIAQVVYFRQFVRNRKSDFGHNCTGPDNEEHLKMFNEGVEWSQRHQDVKNDIYIKSEDGLSLFGEFYNFGHKKTIIFTPGRTESLAYCYYMAIAYEGFDVNILVIDQRAIACSEGIYQTAGILESRDELLWVKYLEEKFGQESFILHGICVGSSCAVLAATQPDCPKSVKGVIVDSLFESFTECIKQHTKLYGKPTFPVVYMVNTWFKHYAKIDMKKITPKKKLRVLDKPILFVHSKNDKVSLPKKAGKLYEICSSRDKTFVWFDEGRHSHIRSAASEKYDKTVREFVGRL